MPETKVRDGGGGGKWTPGEWAYAHRLDYDCMYYRTQIFTPDTGETIATVHWYPEPKPGGVTGTYRDANAAVLTAAPRLYTELARLVAALEPLERNGGWPLDGAGVATLNGARAALALAEGDEG